MRIKKLEVVARVGIEPSTRGFSVRLRAQFGASKPKTGKDFLPGGPNRRSRPSLSRTGTPEFRPNPRGPDPDQRLARIATERFPSPGPNGAALGYGALALTTSRPAPPIHDASERTLYGRDRTEAAVRRCALRDALQPTGRLDQRTGSASGNFQVPSTTGLRGPYMRTT